MCGSELCVEGGFCFGFGSDVSITRAPSQKAICADGLVGGDRVVRC